MAALGKRIIKKQAAILFIGIYSRFYGGDAFFVLKQSVFPLMTQAGHDLAGLTRQCARVNQFRKAHALNFRVSQAPVETVYPRGIAGNQFGFPADAAASAPGRQARGPGCIEPSDNPTIPARRR
jgi:hypothetical protein